MDLNGDQGRGDTKGSKRVFLHELGIRCGQILSYSQGVDNLIDCGGDANGGISLNMEGVM